MLTVVAVAMMATVMGRKARPVSIGEKRLVRCR